MIVGLHHVAIASKDIALPRPWQRGSGIAPSMGGIPMAT